MKCIYVRTNLINGKQYVGQTNDFRQREAEWRCVNINKAKWLREHAINNAVKTAQMDLEGNIIKVWNSAKEASRELGVEYTGICKCRKGEFKTYHNFIWKPYTD